MFFIISIYVSSVAFASEPPTVKWSKIYGGNKYDASFHLIETIEGGYAIVGSTISFGSGEQNCWLVKTDSNGTMEWNKVYGGTGEDFAQSIIQTNDSGFAIVGSTTSFDTEGDYDFLLIKTNSNGELEWYKTYGDIYDDYATSIIKTKDDGYAIAGITNNLERKNDFLLIKIDSNGDIQWSKSYGGYGEEKAWDLLQTNDNGFVLSGSTSSYGSGDSDIWLVKTDSKGIMEWNRTYGGVKFDSAQSIIQTNDNEFVLAGETLSYGSGSYDVWLLKTDSIGTMIWNHTFGGKGEDSAQSILQTTDDGYLLGGFFENGLYYDFFLVKTDNNGYTQWSETYHGGNDEKAYSIIESSDDNYVIAGLTQSQFGYDFLMVKTNNSNTTVDNLFPIANAGADDTALVGQNISFFGSAFDPDGEITLYHWDFDGDGIYDFESNTSGTTTFVYNKSGTYYAFFEVFDDNGSSSTDMRMITVHADPSSASTGFNLLILIPIMAIILLIILFIGRKMINQNLQKLNLKYLSIFLKLDRWTYYLILSFVIITLIKIIGSAFFSTPHIYTDEQNYGVMAKQIFNGNLAVMGRVPFYPAPTPAGYSYFLAPAYLLGDNMEVVYHGMLIINCIISSLLIFPVFYIMRFFVNKKLCFTTSIMIAVIPTILAYNYLLMSENAFYLIFLISCFLLIKTFTYEKFDLRFILYSFLLGISVGLLSMIRLIGIAMVGALFFTFIYKLIKTKNKSVVKYCIPFLPFIPAIIYLFLQEQSLGNYPLSIQLNNLSLIFSDFSSLTRFIQVFTHEISYFILMSYVLFFVFTIFLIIHRKKLPKEKMESLSFFFIYGIFSIIFLIFLTTNHIYWIDEEGYSIYSRYVSAGLPIIFMFGIIGINQYQRIKEKIKSVQLGLISIFVILFLILVFPREQNYKWVNNMDLLWVSSLQKQIIYDIDGFTILFILLGVIAIFITYVVMFKILFKKSFPIFKKQINKGYLIAGVIFVSLLIFFPTAGHILNEETVAVNKGFNEPARWLMQHDLTSSIIIDDAYGAFSGGGLIPERLRFMLADMYFWFPEGNISFMSKEELFTKIPDNIDADYILSTHDLTEYYQSVADFYIDVELTKRQNFVDWHIYKID